MADGIAVVNHVTDDPARQVKMLATESQNLRDLVFVGKLVGRRDRIEFSQRAFRLFLVRDVDNHDHEA